MADAVAHLGRLDVVVNNAGFGITGAAEAFTEEQVRRQLETNVVRLYCGQACRVAAEKHAVGVA